jgi:hypothetical protein
VPQPTGPAGVATGPLPGLGAAPLGGVLANDDPAPVTDRRNPAVVDLALLDLGGEPPTDRVAPADPDGAQTTAEGAYGVDPTAEGGAVVAEQGSGGVPLLGSALLTESRASRPGRPTAPTALAFGVAGPSPSGDGEATRPQGPPCLGAVAESQVGCPAEDGVAARSRSRSVRRTSILAGLSVAFAMTLGLTLPELSDPSRDEDAGRSWVRRLKPGRRPGLPTGGPGPGE